MSSPAGDVAQQQSSMFGEAAAIGSKGLETHSKIGGQSAVNKGDVKFLQGLVSEHQAMDQIAFDTGGKAFYDTNGFKQAIGRAMDNGSNYFTVGYIPEGKERDGRFRRIKLRVDGGNYELSYRRGYFAEDGTKPASRQTVPDPEAPFTAAMLYGAPPFSEVVFQARILPADDPAFVTAKLSPEPVGNMVKDLKLPLKKYVVDLMLNPSGLANQIQPDGRSHNEVEFTVVAYDDSGNRLNYVVRAFGVNMTAEQQARAQVKGLPIRQEIDLPATAKILRIGVHDFLNGHIGTMEVPLWEWIKPLGYGML